MTRLEARTIAIHRWATGGIASGDRVAWVSIKHKKHPKRYRVGYYVRGSTAFSLPALNREMGAGDSWEEAFAVADLRDDEDNNQ